jgi:hypothetical protein
MPASTSGDATSTRGGWNILRNVFRILIAVGLINAIIGISQAILQHSVGLFWLKESLISPDLPGVAKVVFAGEPYIRAYGLLPHPNILGGLVLFSIILTLTYKHIFYSDKNVSHGTFFYLSLSIQIVGGILTFSKSAVLGIILGIIYLKT